MESLLSAMIQATYRIIPTRLGFKVEINRPGEIIQFADGFHSKVEANSWIEEDKRLSALDDLQTPVTPPNLRQV